MIWCRRPNPRRVVVSEVEVRSKIFKVVVW